MCICVYAYDSKQKRNKAKENTVKYQSNKLLLHIKGDPASRK